MDDGRRDAQCRKDLLLQVARRKADGAGVLAGVAAEHFLVEHVLVNDEADPVGFVVHQAQHGHAARMEVQELLHGRLVGEGQAAAADLGRELLRFEGLVAGHHQQVKLRPLPIAEEEVFADVDAQDRVHLRADLHRRGGTVRMVGAVIFDAQLVQKGIGSFLSVAPAGHVRRRAVQKFHGGVLSFISFFSALAVRTGISLRSNTEYRLPCGLRRGRSHTSP